ncbi:MAG: sulfite exporter TauE/SafE family protein [Burkholderiales bacterium]|nr:sulfite exporter TauE/SafE family protein [Burkholderiales bacterium]MDR4516110.1 sulfite exporter TauE/SafE family protein [Nitrosomonas sp.]
MTDFYFLFFAAYFAAIVSGLAGFGGALLLLPVLIETVGINHAVPLLSIIQLTGNFARIGFNFDVIQWKPVGFFLLGAIPSSILGALSFIALSHDWAIRCIGFAILFFVLFKFQSVVDIKTGPFVMVAGGMITGFLSGIVGSAGPLGAAVFLSLGLPPAAYIASESLSALVIHSVKLITYHHYIMLDSSIWVLAVLMGLAVILGTWTAKRVIDHIPRKLFERGVALLLLLLSVSMIFQPW